MFDGILLLGDPTALLYLTVGMVVGIILGFLPGLGGLATLALLMPFMFGMEPVHGLALILGAYGAVSFGGSVTAILTKTPGTGEQVVTTFDGYPMTQQGKGARAVGVSAAASAFGGLFGVIIVFITIPLARQIITLMRPPELFALALLGIMALGLLDARTPAKGIISGALGLMLSFVGFDPVTGVARMTFGNLSLYDGFGITAITMGLFAVVEMFHIYAKGVSIAGDTRVSLSKEKGYRVLDGVLDVVKRWKLMVQCGFIGAAAGVIPGMGGGIAMFFSYGYARSRSSDPESFGQGNVDGIIGPESANNAKEGGSLVPTLTFGIPGSSGMALFIGALLLLGFTPGPDMVRDNLDIVFLIAWLIAISNLIASFIGVGMAPMLARATFLKPEVIAPPLIAIALIGSFIEMRLLIGMTIAVVFAFVGYVFRNTGYSNAGLTLGFVLGPLLDRNLNISLQAYGWSAFLRPITLTILVLAASLILAPRMKRWVARRAERLATGQEGSIEDANSVVTPDD